MRLEEDSPRPAFLNIRATLNFCLNLHHPEESATTAHEMERRLRLRHSEPRPEGLPNPLPEYVFGGVLVAAQPAGHARRAGVRVHTDI